MGGVARATSDAIVICEAAGFSRVLVETVGVGQNETAVVGLVDCLLLVMPPVGGDELQVRAGDYVQWSGQLLPHSCLVEGAWCISLC